MAKKKTPRKNSSKKKTAAKKKTVAKKAAVKKTVAKKPVEPEVVAPAPEDDAPEDNALLLPSIRSLFTSAAPEEAPESDPEEAPESDPEEAPDPLPLRGETKDMVMIDDVAGFPQDKQKKLAALAKERQEEAEKQAALVDASRKAEARAQKAEADEVAAQASAKAAAAKAAKAAKVQAAREKEQKDKAEAALLEAANTSSDFVLETPVSTLPGTESLRENPPERRPQHSVEKLHKEHMARKTCYGCAAKAAYGLARKICIHGPLPLSKEDQDLLALLQQDVLNDCDAEYTWLFLRNIAGASRNLLGAHIKALGIPKWIDKL